MLLHLVGGGHSQVTTARKIRERGYSLLVSDYTRDAPAKKYANYSSMASTFDQEEIERVSRHYSVDGILTAGTDQPVLTCAVTASRLGLPYPIGCDTARAVTDKSIMKPLMADHGIPANPYMLIGEHTPFDPHRCPIPMPAVLKPVDSQGQRGVVLVQTPYEAEHYIPYSRSYSRKRMVLLEEYYPSDEITVSGWVQNSHLSLLSITDRITENNLPHIGICHAHRYPSRHIGRHSDISAIAKRITDVFGIDNGPLYIQMLIGSRGIRVNEIACRIGGAYEDEAIPLVTGYDIAEMVISQAAGVEVQAPGIESHSPLRSPLCCAVLLFFTSQGYVAKTGDFGRIRDLPGVMGGDYHISPGSTVTDHENALQRAGYVVVTAETLPVLEQRVYSVYDQLDIVDSAGSSMIIPLERKKLFP